MLDLTTVQYNIERWMATFVEVPHPALGGWAPCPYARKARLDRDYTVRVGVNPYFDLLNVARDGLGGKSILILAYDPEEFSYTQFTSDIAAANEEALLGEGLIALEDHPEDYESVNGVVMNQGTYALAMIQSLPELDEKSKLLAEKGFYDTWTDDYAEAVFKHRRDPRA